MIDAVPQEAQRRPMPRLLAVMLLATGAWIIVGAAAWAIASVTALL